MLMALPGKLVGAAVLAATSLGGGGLHRLLWTPTASVEPSVVQAESDQPVFPDWGGGRGCLSGRLLRAAGGHA